MKILHTSDWHIGRILNGKSLLEDQRYILEAIRQLIDREMPDVLIIAGDVYDRPVPSKEALELVDRFFAWVILEKKIRTIVISGNHDGRERLDLNAGILKQQGLYIAGRCTPDPEPIVLEDAWGEVAFWCVPFIRPVEYRSLTGDGQATDYDTMYAALCQKITEKMAVQQRNVLITHGLILSGQEGLETIDDSVRPLEVGGIDYARASLFDAFDYTALGHLHRPQKAGSDRVRYGGSLLKYSFSEWRQKKSVTMVTLEEKGSLQVTQHPLTPLRELRIVQGSLDALTDVACYDQPGNDDYLKVILDDPVRQINPMDRLRRVYPNVLEMSYADAGVQTGSRKQKQIKERIKDPLGLFRDFYTAIHDKAPSEALCALFEELLSEPEDEPCGH